MKPNDKQLNAPVNFFKAIASRATSATTPNHIRIDFAPSADEVARKVYLNYGNQDSLPEEVLQHWQEAESQLLAEGNATRVYSIHKRPQLQLSRTTRHESINV